MGSSRERSSEGRSPLRRARLARNWALRDVVEAIDGRHPGGVSGVTESTVSKWELGPVRSLDQGLLVTIG